MGFDWKFGQSNETWGKVIGAIDVAKGALGLIISVYLDYTIITWIVQTPDFSELKEQMRGTKYVYIFAYGGTRWGVVVFLIGLTLWNFLLLVFGKVLVDGVRLVEQNNARPQLKSETGTTKLRFWYIYTLLTNIAFFGLYFRLGQTLTELWSEEFTRLEYSGGIAALIFYYFFACFIPTIYSLAIVHGLVLEIYKIQREEAPIGNARMRSQSIMPPYQDSRL